MNAVQNTQHTPGPWMVEDGVHVVNDADFVATTHNPISDIFPAREQANARLIAAAPELYAILQNLVFNEDQKSCGVSLGSISAAARAALAKVTP